MAAQKRVNAMLLGALLGLFSRQCFADEILFQKLHGPQTGIVVEEDDRSVTIRFPREAIKSINKGGKENRTAPSGEVIWNEDEEYLTLQIPRRSIRMMPQQKTPEVLPVKPSAAQCPRSGANVEPSGDAAGADAGAQDPAHRSPSLEAHANLQQKLLQEEMGAAQGVITWQGKPLRNGRVKIVLESYTGFSLAALERSFRQGGKSPRDEIMLETNTDSKGRYVFDQAPPGRYRLYWMPDSKTGWVHRLREAPDLEIISGRLSIANVPETKH